MHKASLSSADAPGDGATLRQVLDDAAVRFLSGKFPTPGGWRQQAADQDSDDKDDDQNDAVDAVIEQLWSDNN